MHFYAQQVNVDKVSRQHVVILDVASISDHLKLATALGSQSGLVDGNSAGSQPSMLSFTYKPFGYQSLKEGSWYDIDVAAFSGMRYQQVGPDFAGASFLRANLVGTPSESNFAQYLTAPQAAQVPVSDSALVVEPNPTSSVTLTVVDCGHGNWNEICTSTDRVIYDVGASRQFNKAQVRAVVAKRNLLTERRSISVIISHWDVDHYLALLEFSPAELAKLRAVFMPSQVPNTETYRRVEKLLTDHGVALTALQPAPRTNASRTIVLEPQSETGIFTVFRATPGRSRNQTGIVLGVRGPNEVALLTGDHHYDKLLAAARKMTAYGQSPCVLVAPHHGGLAGRASATAWLTFFSSMKTPISCGANPYGHPFAEVEAELRAMQAGVAAPRTDLCGTWSKSL